MSGDPSPPSPPSPTGGCVVTGRGPELWVFADNSDNQDSWWIYIYGYNIDTYMLL